MPSFLSITRSWEYPEHFLHGLYKDGVAVVEDIHAYQVEIDEVQDQVLDLVLLDANAYQVAQLQVMEDLVLEEYWNAILDRKIFRSTFVCWIACQLGWERCRAGLSSEIKHE